MTSVIGAWRFANLSILYGENIQGNSENGCLLAISAVQLNLSLGFFEFL